MNGTFPFITLPERQEKPRSYGITMVIDKGLGLRETEDLLQTASAYVDLVKLGFGTAHLYPEEILRKKIGLFTDYGVRVCPGGTFSEVAVIQGKFDDYLARCKELGFTGLEISDGVNHLSTEEKTALIGQAVEEGFSVTSEIGRKDPVHDAELSIDDRIRAAQAELEAGSSYVIMEARESGSLGIFAKDTSVKEDVVEQLLNDLPKNEIIFEAPKKSQQMWLIQKLGCNVNLGNINPSEVVALEALRTGLRGDTTLDFHKRP